MTVTFGTVASAKAIGFVVGTVFAFIANRYWTFQLGGQAMPREVGRFTAVYGTTLAANVGINSGVLAVIGRDQTSLIAAFVIATGVSATLNFLGMKFFAFSSTVP